MAATANNLANPRAVLEQKIVFELSASLPDEIIRWLKYLADNVLAVSSPESYFRVQEIIKEFIGGERNECRNE